MFSKKFITFLLCIFCIFQTTFSNKNINSNFKWKLMLLKVFDKVRNNYVEKDIDQEKLIHGGIKGMLTTLNDPYTRFLEPKKHSEMQISLNGNFFGVGMYIGLKDDQLTIISPMDDSPAAKAGIKALDRIISIDAKTTEGLSLEEAVSKIRGPKGSKVVLSIKREGTKDTLIIPIIRDKIKIKSIETPQMLTDNIGYLRLISFENKNATKQVRKAIQKLKKQGMQKLIFDLRNNGGGLLSNAIEISSLFLDDGTVVYTVDREQHKISLPVHKNQKIFSGALAVLINGASASASEILAGAIKDSNRGILVGTKTFGKASVQNIVSLDDGSALLLTIAKYLTPAGHDINKTGINPNYEAKIPTTDIKAMKDGNYIYNIKTDYQIQKALKFLENL